MASGEGGPGSWILTLFTFWQSVGAMPDVTGGYKVPQAS